MRFIVTAAALIAGLQVNAASAEQYVVEVNGIVCEFCSYGVARNVSRLPFVDRKQLERGVAVDIRKQLVTVAVDEAATLDREALFAAIRSGGYDPVAIWRIDENGQHQALD